MKEVLVAASDSHPSGLTTSIHDIPTPKPGPTEVLIRVTVSGSNPKDWKMPVMFATKFSPSNSGDDIAGTIAAVGEKVYEFAEGDRVAAFHVMRTGGGSFAEYAVAPAHTTFKLPIGVSDEEGATIPLAAMTAAIGVFLRLGLPEPWNTDQALRERTKGGVVVYGAAGAVGAFAVKLLVRADVHPIICVAGRGKDFVEGLIDRSKGDTVVDYRQGDEEVVKGIKNAVPEGKVLRYAFDGVSEKGSYENCVKVLDQQDAAITMVLPPRKDYSFPSGIHQTITLVGSVHDDEKTRDFGYAWYRLMAKGMAEGWFPAHPHEVVPGGLGGVEQGLRNLKEGKNSAVKYVFRVGETEGLGGSKM